MNKATLYAVSSGFDRFLGWWLLAASALLVAGLTLPALTVDRFFIFTDRFSILQAMARLMEEGEWLLAAAVLLFSVLFPAAKILFAFWLWHGVDPRGPRFHKIAHRLEVLGKWSMLDVLVAALMIFSIKASAVADATAQPGLYLFMASVVISMVAVYRVRRIAEAQDHHTKGDSA
jgi:paraquat-inducible protein A